MASRRNTIFNRLQTVFSEPKPLDVSDKHPNTVVIPAATQAERENKLQQVRQQKMLSRQWRRAMVDVDNYSLAGLNEVRLMYRDADVMDGFPEIGAALDIYAEEACSTGKDGMMLNIKSQSERVAHILQDLFYNRLSINVVLPMLCRAMCKYGNAYSLLNTTSTNGIIGWKELPVYDIERYEHGMRFPYNGLYDDNGIATDTRFVWTTQGSSNTAYRNWQVAHFRLLYDSQFLPYGVSALHKARRHFRLLSMMEDAMLIYRLDRSMDRRVFRVNVGAIDDQDVPAYIDDIANNFKRSIRVDPETGQLDLSKQQLSTCDDFVIPYRPGEENVNSVEVLSAGSNQTALDDIKFIQNKIFTALRIPKALLNFEESKGDGQNLSMQDIRLARMIHRIQQALLMELNKVAIIHLCLLGFEDELTNFQLSMNNPSNQLEMLEIDCLAKKITTAKDAVTDAGGGFPLTSLSWAWRNILKWSDKDIKRNLEELRLENALGSELKMTNQIINRTGLFDTVDNIYGVPGAQYGNPEGGGPNEGDGDSGGFSGGFSGGIPGGGLDFGDDSGDFEGESGEMGMADAASEDFGPAPDMGGDMEDGGVEPPKGAPISDSIANIFNKALLAEQGRHQRTNKNSGTRSNDTETETPSLSEQALIINEEIDLLCKNLEQIKREQQSEGVSSLGEE